MGNDAKNISSGLLPYTNCWRITHSSKTFWCLTLLAFGIGVITTISNILRTTQSGYSSPMSSSTVAHFLKSYNCVSNKNPYCHNATIPPVLQPRDLCTSPLDLLVMIESAVEHASQRTLIRNTWLQTDDRYNVSHVFVLGLPVTPSVYNEAQLFNNILVGDFNDTYRNLTWKTVFGYRWLMGHFSGVKYFMKTDDDVYVNIVPILDTLYEMPPNKPMLVGNCFKEKIVIRWPKGHRYHVSKEMYPGDRYPRYCCGCGYVISGPTARDVANVLLQLPFLTLEDALVGIAVAKLNYTVDIINLYPRFGVINISNETTLCANVKSGVALTLHSVNSYLMQKLNDSCLYGSA